jgi:hypothetical protein
MIVTIVLAGATVGLLVRAAWKAPTRQHVLMIRSGPEWEGVELIVEGGSLPEPAVASIEHWGNYTVPFFLPSGQYTLKVKSNGEQIYATHVNLVEQEVQEIDLTRKGVTTRPASRPATQPR